MGGNVLAGEGKCGLWGGVCGRGGREGRGERDGNLTPLPRPLQISILKSLYTLEKLSAKRLAPQHFVRTFGALKGKNTEKPKTMNDYIKFNRDLIRETINTMMELEGECKNIKVDPLDPEFYSKWVSEMARLLGRYQGHTTYLHSVLQRLEEFEKTME